MTNNVSFTSRINFVDSKTFDRFMKGAYVDFRTDHGLIPPNKINERIVSKLTGKPIYKRSDVLEADEFYTDTVRTCTAGGIVDTKTGKAVGFHIYDSDANADKTDEILDNIFAYIPNPDRALVLGSKKLKGSVYSIPIFQKILEGIKKRVQNVSVFNEHIFPYSETDMHYSLKNDTWTIRSMYRPLMDYKEYEIESKDDLAKCFRDFKIADGDFITFDKDIK